MCSNDDTRILVLEEQVKSLSDELTQCQVCMIYLCAYTTLCYASLGLLVGLFRRMLFYAFHINSKIPDKVEKFKQNISSRLSRKSRVSKKTRLCLIICEVFS